MPRCRSDVISKDSGSQCSISTIVVASIEDFRLIFQSQILDKRSVREFLDRSLEILAKNEPISNMQRFILLAPTGENFNECKCKLKEFAFSLLHRRFLTLLISTPSQISRFDFRQSFLFLRISAIKTKSLLYYFSRASDRRRIHGEKLPPTVSKWTIKYWTQRPFRRGLPFI